MSENSSIDGINCFPAPETQYSDDDDSLVYEDYNSGQFVMDPSLLDDVPYMLFPMMPEDMRILSDDVYEQQLELPVPVTFPDPQCVEEDICALVAGVMMAKSDFLDTGLTSEEFDGLLQDVTGRKIDSPGTRCINLMELPLFMHLTPDELDKATKDKGNILCNGMFSKILQHNVASGKFRFKIHDQDPPIKDLYEAIKASGALRRKRREMAEKVKTDKMSNLENRRRYMISNNLLVELIASVLDKNCRDVAEFDRIRDVYRAMMTDKDALYQKYNPLLDLDKINVEIGPELNKLSIRNLFGRGTITKALSNPIYGNISWTPPSASTKEKILFPRNRHKSIQEMSYGKEDFEDINAQIKERNRQQKPYNRNNNRHPIRQPNKEEREAMELEERRKTYQPVNLNTENIFIPTADVNPTFFGGLSSTSDNNREGQNTANSRNKPVNIDNRRPTDNQRSDKIVETPPERVVKEFIPDERVMHTEPAKNVFGRAPPKIQSFPLNNKPASSDSEGSLKREFAYTDEEEEAKNKPPPKKDKTKKVKAPQASSVASTLTTNSIAQSVHSKVTQWDVPIRDNNNVKHYESTRQVVHPFLQSNIPASSQSFARPSRSPHPRTSTAYNSARPSPVRVLSPPVFLEEPLLNRMNRHSNEADLFLDYIKLHVFLHRHPEGAPRRYWSQIQKYLDYPMNKPEILLGSNWAKELHDDDPNLEVVHTSSDILFEWVNGCEPSCSVTSRMRF